MMGESPDNYKGKNYYKAKIQQILLKLKKREIEKQINPDTMDLEYNRGLAFASSLIEEELARDLDLDIEKIENYALKLKKDYYLSEGGRE